MSILLAFVGATLAGALGWWLGAFIGPMSAYLVSTIASGFGFYYGRKLAAGLLD
jgi:hypothetical protein